MPIIEWVADRALRSGVLAEQVNPYTDEPLSVAPLTWSHAAFITVVQEYLRAVERFDRCPTCGNPRFHKQMDLESALPSPVVEV